MVLFFATALSGQPRQLIYESLRCVSAFLSPFIYIHSCSCISVRLSPSALHLNNHHCCSYSRAAATALPSLIVPRIATSAETLPCLPESTKKQTDKPGRGSERSRGGALVRSVLSGCPLGGPSGACKPLPLAPEWHDWSRSEARWEKARSPPGSCV